MRDEDIDYSENPRLTPEFFRNAMRWPGKKELISLRLDPDVLAFFRRQGKGYQTTINLLLRKYMEAQTIESWPRIPSSRHAQPHRRSELSRKKK